MAERIIDIGMRKIRESLEATEAELRKSYENGRQCTADEARDEELDLVVQLLENRAKLCAHVGDENSARELRDAITRLKAGEHR